MITIEDFHGDVFRTLMMTASDALAEWRAPAKLLDRVGDIAAGLEGVRLGRAIGLASQLARVPSNLA
ncbi:hypothetical protein NQU49_28420, partial [Escherichia coli]|uniref:hypothetical protein n=1 Tax=Escherichia coli TaxID=562 RepID=UPI0021185899